MCLIETRDKLPLGARAHLSARNPPKIILLERDMVPFGGFQTCPEQT